MKRSLFFLVLYASFGLYTECDHSPNLTEDPASYMKSVEKWQLDRLDGLKSKEGWLKEGTQTFGSDPSNDIVFPAKAPAIEALDHIPSFPIDPEYVVEAQLNPYDEAKPITVNTPFQNYTQDYECPGELHFKLKGKKMTLLPFISRDEYFIILSDETSGFETYGGGRFMYATPDSDGRILLDFNKAYNPPCAITAFAACPMPPRDNHLPVRVEAGEKSIEGHK